MTIGLCCGAHHHTCGRCMSPSQPLVQRSLATFNVYDGKFLKLVDVFSPYVAVTGHQTYSSYCVIFPQVNSWNLPIE